MEALEQARAACEKSRLGINHARLALEYAQQLHDADLAKLEELQKLQPADVSSAPSQGGLLAAAAGAAAAAKSVLQLQEQRTPPPTPTMLPLDHFSRLEQMEGCYFATMTKESAKDFIKPVPEDRLRFVVYPNLDKQKEKGYSCQVFRATYRNYRDELTHMDFCRSPVNLGLCHDDKFDLADCYPTVTAFLDSRLQKHGRDYGKLLRPWPTAESHPGHILSVPGSKPPVVGVLPAEYKRQAYKPVSQPLFTTAALPGPDSKVPLSTALPEATVGSSWVPAPAASAYKNKCVKSQQPVDP
jgi:hypothetical protein